MKILKLATGAHSQSSPASRSPPFACGRTTFVVSSHQPPQNAKKNAI